MDRDVLTGRPSPGAGAAEPPSKEGSQFGQLGSFHAREHALKSLRAAPLLKLSKRAARQRTRPAALDARRRRICRRSCGIWLRDVVERDPRGCASARCGAHRARRVDSCCRCNVVFAPARHAADRGCHRASAASRGRRSCSRATGAGRLVVRCAPLWAQADRHPGASPKVIYNLHVSGRRS